MWITRTRTGSNLYAAIVALGVAGLICVVPGSEARAQSGSPPGLSMFRQWASAPIYEWFGGELQTVLARRLQRIRWPVPERREWPTDAEGEPIVETKRLSALDHTVQPGETLERIRSMYRTTYARLRRWNPDTHLASGVEPGQTLTVWKRKPEKIPRSYGAAQWGRLAHGEPLPSGEAYTLQSPHRAFGTYYVVSEIRRLMKAYATRFPDGPNILVGDISFRTGRSMYPHKSHRTGRDVDLTYPRLDEPPSWRRFYEVPLSELDVEKTLFLVRTLLKKGYVQYIFMDRYIQRALRRRAEKLGAPERWLETVFEYPEWDSHESIIRHEPGHQSHMHVRFWCQPTDRRCPR